MRWRRLDVPGTEEASVEATTGGWRLAGELHVTEAGIAARLGYEIACDECWRTRAARVVGEAGGTPVRLDLDADGAGRWSTGGRRVPALDGALDVDLGFTPATNLLPIRRLALAVGGTAPVRTAWFRFPELRLEILDQRYTRLSTRAYRYEALVDAAPFSARLDTDAYGRVMRYEGLWEAELMEPGDGE